MLKKRLVACFIARRGLLVQSVEFSRYYPIGHPQYAIEFIAKWDIDEIIFLDISATPEKRIVDIQLIDMLSKSCFVPLTVGGGINSVDAVQKIIRAGADKVCINSHALERPSLISEIASSFGRQCVVVSIDCKLAENDNYKVCYQSGNIPTKYTPAEWAKEVELLGAGEIFLTSIDRDGTKKGYDERLISSVTEAVSIPVIASGGVGNYDDFYLGLKSGAAAVSAANIFHYIEHSTILAKAHLLQSGIDIRLDSEANYKQREFDEQGRLIMLSSESLSSLDI